MQAYVIYLGVQVNWQSEVLNFIHEINMLWINNYFKRQISLECPFLYLERSCYMQTDKWMDA